METTITLITFRGCPNADPTRALLRRLGIAYRDVTTDDLSPEHPWRKFSSPTIFRNDELVFGSEQVGAGACSLGMPTQEQIKNILAPNEVNTMERQAQSVSWLSFAGSIGSAITVGLCPVCIPAVGALLSAIGLGFLAQESVLKPLLLLLLTLTVAGLAWSWIKEHRRPWPLIVGFFCAVMLYAGRYVYFGGGMNETMEIGGMAGLIAASLWNLKLRRDLGCSSCRSDTQRHG